MRSDPATDAHALQLQIETSFCRDSAGRLLTTAEPSSRPAPRFFLGRTRHGNLWRFRADLSDAAVRHLSRLASREPALLEVPQDEPPPPDRMQSFRDVLEGEGRRIETEWRGPAFRVPETLPAPASEFATVHITSEHADVLAPHFPWLLEELSGRAPAVGILSGGEIVSLCCCARVGSDAVEASLETVGSARRSGFASAVVAAWAGDVRAMGLLPLYSTSWSNTASRAVAARLGLLPYGEDIHFT